MGREKDIFMKLTEESIQKSLPKVERGLKKYCTIQSMFDQVDVREDLPFQRTFNGFYRVRRGSDWRHKFYALLESCKTNQMSFEEVLGHLRDATGYLEASFASKLVATTDTSRAVIDSWVLKNLGMSLPFAYVQRRQEKIVELYEQLNQHLYDVLDSDSGRYLVTRFEETYPRTGISKIKMLDLVLWQVRTTD